LGGGGLIGSKIAETDIEVLDQPDTNYWTTTGLPRCPDTPHKLPPRPGGRPDIQGWCRVNPQTLRRSFHHEHPANGEQASRPGRPASARGANRPSAADCPPLAPASICRSIGAARAGSPTPASGGRPGGTYGFFGNGRPKFTLPARGGAGQTLNGVRFAPNNQGTRVGSPPIFPIWKSGPGPYRFNTNRKRPMWSRGPEEHQPCYVAVSANSPPRSWVSLCLAASRSGPPNDHHV